ncbi:MAG TPA: alpha/beta fold hydrolase [Caulobacteraceae bacterium]|jgi:pimeloyl-ACP methyl ester carboxylesterase
MTIRAWLFALALAGFAAAPAQAADAPPPIPAAVAGHWQGELVQQGQALAVSFDLVADPGAPSGRFSADRWQVMDYPIGGMKLDGASFDFGLNGLELDGTLARDTISGTFKGNDGTGTFTLHRTARTPAPYDVTEVTFKDGDVTLSGTIVMPRTPGRHPAVVMTHGSGPETRWGTSRYVADRFARAGVAALIYDKRGSGQSSGDWKTASYEDLARDALAAVDALAHRPGVDPKRIGVLGHSEGGIVAPIVETLAPGKVAFLVAEDTPAQVIKQQDVYRVGNDISSQDWSTADKALALDTYKLFVDAAAGDRPMADYEAARAKYKDAAWFQYMGLPDKDSWVWAWYRPRAHLDIATLWTRVKRPVLLIYGEQDQLMPVDQTIHRLEDILDANGAPYAAFIVPRAEHNLSVHPAAGDPFFWWRQAPGLNDTVAAWILRCTAPDGPCRTD